VRSWMTWLACPGLGAAVAPYPSRAERLLDARSLAELPDGGGGRRSSSDGAEPTGRAHGLRVVFRQVPTSHRGRRRIPHIQVARQHAVRRREAGYATCSAAPPCLAHLDRSPAAVPDLDQLVSE
jgi:hypothetical protein